MKYIIIKDRDDFQFSIVFPDSVIHKDVARIHRATDIRVVSAGFCSLGSPVSVWGRSESIDKDSRPLDAKIIDKDFNEQL